MKRNSWKGILVLMVFVAIWVVSCSLAKSPEYVLDKSKNLINIVYFSDSTKQEPSSNFPVPDKKWGFSFWDKDLLREAIELNKLIGDELEDLGVLEIPSITKLGLTWGAGDIEGKRIVGIFFKLLKKDGPKGPGYYYDGSFYIWFYFDPLENKETQKRLIKRCARVIYDYFVEKDKILNKGESCLDLYPKKWTQKCPLFCIRTIDTVR